MSRTRGFTLIEVVLALVITGVVALVAYGALAAATDTRQRLEEDRTDALTQLAWEGLLREAVRSVRDPRAYGAATLVVEDGFGEDGRPSDRLGLVTAAGSPPLSPGTDWRILLQSEEGRGVVARASPLGPWRGPRDIRGPAGLTGLSVEVLGPQGWSASWRSAFALPRALRITYWRGDAPVEPAVLVAIPLGMAP